jgi:hypothetical protein
LSASDGILQRLFPVYLNLTGKNRQFQKVYNQQLTILFAGLCRVFFPEKKQKAGSMASLQKTI